MKKPVGVHDLSDIVIDAVQRLVEKRASVGEVKAIIAGINSVQAGLALRQEQARLSGARVNGDVIMDLQLDPHAEPSLSSKVNKVIETKAKARSLPAKRSKAA